MNKRILTSILFFLCIYCFGTVPHVEAAVCPTSTRYAVINYDHWRVHQVDSGTNTVRKSVALYGPVGIKISPAGIVNAGNKTLNRRIDHFSASSSCFCLADLAQSRVTVTVSGACTDGILNMQIHEVYPDSSALVSCACDTGDGQYTQLYPGYTLSFPLIMDYVNGNTIKEPYTCPGCSGTYSYHLQFVNKPPPIDHLVLVPLIFPLLFD